MSYRTRSHPEQDGAYRGSATPVGRNFLHCHHRLTRKIAPQPLTAHEFTCNPFGLTNLPANFSYLHENEEFEGRGEGEGYPVKPPV